MRNFFFFTIILAQTIIVVGQGLNCPDFGFGFEDDYCINQLTIDTVSNPNNLWQIGKPQKAVFNSSHSSQNAIVTDTINTYPQNDTSSFTIKKLAGAGFEYAYLAEFGGYYFVDSDTLNDFGIIEFSPDNGTTWIDLVNDSIYNIHYHWDTPKPVLSGKSNGWKEFTVNLARLGGEFDIQMGDTVIYRFTFISDSKLDSFDGLMFDDLYSSDWYEGIEESGIEKLNSTIFPNPATNKIYLEFNNPEFFSFQLKIFDNLGRQLLEIKEVDGNMNEIDVAKFSSGVYFYRLLNTQERKGAWGKFIIE